MIQSARASSTRPLYAVVPGPGDSLMWTFWHSCRSSLSFSIIMVYLAAIYLLIILTLMGSHRVDIALPSIFWKGFTGRGLWDNQCSFMGLDFGGRVQLCDPPKPLSQQISSPFHIRLSCFSLWFLLNLWVTVLLRLCSLLSCIFSSDGCITCKCSIFTSDYSSGL